MARDQAQHRVPEQLAQGPVAAGAITAGAQEDAGGAEQVGLAERVGVGGPALSGPAVEAWQDAIAQDDESLVLAQPLRQDGGVGGTVAQRAGELGYAGGDVAAGAKELGGTVERWIEHGGLRFVGAP